MYHRIAKVKFDPWDLCVTPENFEQQLDVLSKRYRVIPLDELIDQLKKGRFFKNAVSITFDDGYIDNYTVAKPLLEKFNLPATFFIPTLNVGKNKEYWWDELEQIISNAESNSSILIQIGGSKFQYKFEAQSRLKCYMEIWEKLLPEPHIEQQRVLDGLRSQLNIPEDLRADYWCMDANAIKEISRSHLFNVEAHTFSHPALSYHSKQFQEEELRIGQQQLSVLSGQPVRFIAYPYGNYNAATTALASQYYKAAFTTEEKMVTRTSEKYKLGRFMVKDWGGEEFEGKLHAWVADSARVSI